MEREIKFRLRIGDKIVGYERWYIGDGGISHWEYLEINDTVWRPTYIYHTKKDQLTGLLDKNGNEIYEGDIVRVQNLYETEEPVDAFLCKVRCIDNWSYEVVDNIYTDSHLLK